MTGTPVCVTAAVRPATVMVPVRGDVLAADATSKATVPGPVPEAVLASEIHVSTACAVQSQSAGVAAMLTMPAPPADGKLDGTVLTPKVHDAPA